MQPLKWFFDIIKQTKRSFILSHVCSYHTFEHIANLKKIAQHRDNANILYQHEKLSILSHISVFCREFLFVLYIFLPIFFRQSFSFFQISVRQTTDKQKTTRTTAKMNDKVLFRRKMISSLVNYQRCCFCFFFCCLLFLVDHFLFIICK